MQNSYFNNTNNYTLDTGTPRHVVGHAVSGAVLFGFISGIVNVKKCRNGEIDRNEAIRNTLKDSAVGSVMSATSVAVANDLGNPNKNMLQTAGTLALGAGAIYAIEKAASLQTKKIAIKNENQEKEK